MGFFYYVKNEKEVGKIVGYFNHSVCASACVGVPVVAYITSVL